MSSTIQCRAEDDTGYNRKKQKGLHDKTIKLSIYMMDKKLHGKLSLLITKKLWDK